MCDPLRLCITLPSDPSRLLRSPAFVTQGPGNIIKDMSPDQRIAWGEAEYSKLERCYGQDLPERLNAAGQMVRQIELEQGPGLVNILKQVGDHAMVAKMLIDQAPRFWARRKGR